MTNPTSCGILFLGFEGMTMRLLALLMAASLASCEMPRYARSTSAPGLTEPTDILSGVGEVLPGVVQIYSVNERHEGISRGSGVVIYRGRTSLILTARHMTEGDGVSGYVIRKDKWAVEARCVKRGIEPQEDWALLETDYPVGDAVPTLESAQFSRVCMPYAATVCIGYALGWNTVTVTVGHIQEYSPPSIRMSAPIIYGNSGGGMFVLDTDGRLKLAGITVAVGTGGFNAIPHMGLSVDIGTIRRRGGLSR